MNTVDARRDSLKALLAPYSDKLARSRKAFFDTASFALADKHDQEFQIKSKVADHFQVPFRSIVFTGSAQLGFSPQKDSLFQPGLSDLDIACISSELFVLFWEEVIESTRAFTDLSGFRDAKHQENLQDHILRRGMILLDFMPNSMLKRNVLDYFDKLGAQHRAIFNRISFAVYINEYAFCWKQNSAIANILGK